MSIFGPQKAPSPGFSTNGLPECFNTVLKAFSALSHKASSPILSSGLSDKPNEQSKPNTS